VAEPGPDGRPREVLARRAFVRLRRGEGGAVAPEQVEALAAVVGEQAREARAAGATDVRAVATGAVRGAGNRDAVLDAVERASGLRVRLLGPEDEARLAFAGVMGCLGQAPPEPIAVSDVGGGSSELVVGTRDGEVSWWASLPLGSGALADALLPSDPPAPGELAAARECVVAAFAPVRAPRAASAYAVGGSATSLRRLVGEVLDAHALAAALDVLAALPSTEVARRYGLHPERARLLPAGILLLAGAVAALGVPLQTCGGGLREGVVLEEFAKMRGDG
jgi:exopolyphosphatase/guanosine-5'-triphosphate,3'-diphosphate pyrophosphatase